VNAPLAELVRWRVLDCAKHSPRLRKALRAARSRAALVKIRGRSGLPAHLRLRGMKTWLVASRWTIGPRGVLP